jgi:hypothetical protein
MKMPAARLLLRKPLESVRIDSQDSHSCARALGRFSWYADVAYKAWHGQWIPAEILIGYMSVRALFNFLYLTVNCVRLQKVCHMRCDL